jgi:hypothetical protein
MVRVVESASGAPTAEGAINNLPGQKAKAGDRHGDIREGETNFIKVSLASASEPKRRLVVVTCGSKRVGRIYELPSMDQRWSRVADQPLIAAERPVV